MNSDSATLSSITPRWHGSTSGSARARRRRRPARQAEPGDPPAASGRVGSLQVHGLAEVGDAAEQQALGEIGQAELGSIRELEPVGGPSALEPRELGIRVELLNLAVDRGVDAGQEVEAGGAVEKEDRIESGEPAEQV